MSQTELVAVLSAALRMMFDLVRKPKSNVDLHRVLEGFHVYKLQIPSGFHTTTQKFTFFFRMI